MLVIQSLNVAPYEEALAGFKSVCDAEITKIVLSNQEKFNPQIIQSNHPELILAIGMDALTKTKEIKDIPIIYMMVLNPQTIASGENNISGISMTLSPEKQMTTILEVLPAAKRVGILYHPDRTGSFVRGAVNAANNLGISLVAERVQNTKEVPSALKNIRNQIDAFWMIPDITVYSPETIEFLILFWLENRKPIISFSEKYVELGALMSISIDPFDIGTQAGEMAKTVLSNTGGNKNAQRIDARKAVILINMRIAKKLGITFDEKVLAKAKVLN
ncbi:MAG TPA: ABC transporter substrate binding protein [Thermodesulfobacteriota bacterium]|nr:ABC transporter substrate binding protein [Thermodesulfobacteriota bacterium]